MSRLTNMKRIGFLASVILLLVAVQGCSTDSPTAPEQVPAPPPTSGGNNWKITVKVNPSQLIAGSDVPSTVTARVESRDNPGETPPNGTTVSFSTSLGEFGFAGSEATFEAASLDRGKASVLLFAGDIVAGGTVSVALEGSVGRRDFSVVSQETFITSVSPNTGPASGGTVVTIEGVNFRENARVRFGDGLGDVRSVTSTRIVVTTPPGILNTETCTTGGGLPGTRQVDTPVTITLEFADGGSESLSGAFTYLSPSNTCVEN